MRAAGALLAMSCAAASALAQESMYRDPANMECPILDMPFFESWGLEAGGVGEAETDAPGWENVSVAEASAWGRIGDFENDWGGDLDLRALVDTMVLTFNDYDDAYALTMARVNLQWSQRFEGGTGFEVDAAPGLYSSFDTFKSDDFAVPCGASFVQALNPHVAGFLGASVYPGFDETLVPRGGIRLAHGNKAVLDIAYPESRLVLGTARAFRLTTGIRVSDWPEYNMGDDPRERLRYDEVRAYATMQFGVGEMTGFMLQGGYVMDREVSFESDDTVINIEDAPFVRIGFYGRM